MKTVLGVIVATAFACSTFDGFAPIEQAPVTWGGIIVTITTFGLSIYDKHTYTVSVDSAIQGYALRTSEGGIDTVTIEPLLAGRHHVSVSAVRPYCVVSNGAERDTVVVVGRNLEMHFRVECVYPDGTTPP
jgi:hypothetical protein